MIRVPGFRFAASRLRLLGLQVGFVALRYLRIELVDFAAFNPTYELRVAGIN